MAAARQLHVIDGQRATRPYWSQVLRALRHAAGLTLVEWVNDLQETPCEVVDLLDLRRTSGVREPDWTARAEAILATAEIQSPRQIRLLRQPIACSVDTVQRWESGRLVPNAAAQEAIIVTCLVHNLFGTFPQQPFHGEPITPAALRQLLAEARLGDPAGRADRGREPDWAPTRWPAP